MPHRNPLQAPELTSLRSWRRVHCREATLAEISKFSIVTYERRPGYWRAAITPIRPSSGFIQGKTTTSFVTPDDFDCESDAKAAAEKIIRKL
jgi:hypothetical protein